MIYRPPIIIRHESQPFSEAVGGDTEYVFRYKQPNRQHPGRLWAAGPYASPGDWSYERMYYDRAEKMHDLINSSLMRNVMRAAGFEASVDNSYNGISIYDIGMPAVQAIADFCRESRLSRGRAFPKIVPHEKRRFTPLEGATALNNGEALISTLDDHDITTHLAGWFAVSPLLMDLLKRKSEVVLNGAEEDPELPGRFMRWVDGGIAGARAMSRFVYLDNIVPTEPIIPGAESIEVYAADREDRIHFLHEHFALVA